MHDRIKQARTDGPMRRVPARFSVEELAQLHLFEQADFDVVEPRLHDCPAGPAAGMKYWRAQENPVPPSISC